MWGTVKTEMQFTQLEYLGGETIPTVGMESMPDAPPLWRLRGTAVYDVSFNFAGTEEGQDAAVATWFFRVHQLSQLSEKPDFYSKDDRASRVVAST